MKKKVVVRLDCVIQSDTAGNLVAATSDAFSTGLKVMKRLLKQVGVVDWESTLRVTDANIGYVVEKEG